MIADTAGTPRHYRCVGIGVGPANLSLASLMYGHPEITILFLDEKKCFDWDVGRIYHFLNAQFDAVPRQEFRNYLEWASRKNENVVFGRRVHLVEHKDRFLVHATGMTVTADNMTKPSAREFEGDER